MSTPTLRSLRVPAPKNEVASALLANRGDLLAHLSHELRTPLNTVLGIAELLADSSLTVEQRRHVEMLRRAGADLLALANALLGVAPDAIPQIATEPQPGRTLQARLAGVRVLVVDDSEESRDLLEAYLTGTGTVVAFAESGAGALEAVARQTFDLVLMDMHLPDASGLDTAGAIRRAERERGAPPVPIVVLSADPLSSTLARALAAGCSTCLAKPVARTTLLEAIVANRTHPSHRPSPALKERFLEHRAREVITARAALRREDFPLLVTLGHNLSGNGLSFGFPRLSAVGRRIETAALGRRVAELDDLIAQLACAVADAAGAPEQPREEALSGTHARPGTRDRG